MIFSQEWDHSIWLPQPAHACGVGAEFDATSESTIKGNLGIMYSTGKAAYKPLPSYSARVSDAASRGSVLRCMQRSYMHLGT